MQDFKSVLTAWFTGMINSSAVYYFKAYFRFLWKTMVFIAGIDWYTNHAHMSHSFDFLSLILFCRVMILYLTYYFSFFTLVIFVSFSVFFLSSIKKAFPWSLESFSYFSTFYFASTSLWTPLASYYLHWSIVLAEF